MTSWPSSPLPLVEPATTRLYVPDMTLERRQAPANSSTTSTAMSDTPAGDPAASSTITSLPPPTSASTTSALPSTTSSSSSSSTSDTTSSTSTIPSTSSTSTSTTSSSTTSSTSTSTSSTSSSTSSSSSSTTTSTIPSTSTTSISSTSIPPSTTVVTITPTDTDGVTSVTVVTSTSTNDPTSTSATDTSATAEPTPIDPSASHSGGLDQKAKVAIGVVVPIVVIAILAVIGLFFWKRRRARQQAAEERRKEVEDYAYNPNADPTIPPVGMAMNDNAYEMREDSSGYRGWGTTTVAGSGRKASTTMSGGMTEATSPTHAGYADRGLNEPLMDGTRSPEGEILGAMGPSAANNRADVHRGPSNASSSYSAANRSDGSDNGYYGNGNHYDSYGQNPYGDHPQRQEMPAQPVIRDNPARRNTRIESPSHYPQQSAGISQNF